MKRMNILCSAVGMIAAGMLFVCCTGKPEVKETEVSKTDTVATDSKGMDVALNNIKGHQEDIQALWEMTIGSDKKFAKYAVAGDYVVVGSEDGKDCLLLSFYKDKKDAENFDGIALKDGQTLSIQGSALLVSDKDKTTYYETTESEGFNELFTITEKDGKKTYTNDLDEPYQESDAQAFIAKTGNEAAKPLADMLGEWQPLK
ncbi:MAG: hypothetical protein IJS43_02320 [Bacteroidaceae bacterium]|nr:hypothetical protein [Bacteroidaceae bacterium]